MNDFQCVLEEDDGERLIHRLPAAFLSRLSLSDADTLKRATRLWAKTDELACDPPDLEPLIETLVDLAQRAQDTGRNLYLWTSV